MNLSPYKLMPMGSHPRVADKHSTYDLFGPVNKLWSHKYDKAMISFLACLKEFGQAAHNEDVAVGKQEPFKFPFPIDGDKVGEGCCCGCMEAGRVHSLSWRRGRKRPSGPLP